MNITWGSGFMMIYRLRWFISNDLSNEYSGVYDDFRSNKWRKWWVSYFQTNPYVGRLIAVRAGFWLLWTREEGGLYFPPPQETGKAIWGFLGFFKWETAKYAKSSEVVQHWSVLIGTSLVFGYLNLLKRTNKSIYSLCRLNVSLL